MSTRWCPYHCCLEPVSEPAPAVAAALAAALGAPVGAVGVPAAPTAVAPNAATKRGEKFVDVRVVIEAKGGKRATSSQSNSSLCSHFSTVSYDHPPDAEWFSRHRKEAEEALTVVVNRMIEEKPSAPLVYLASQLLELATTQKAAGTESQIASLREALQTTAFAEARMAETLTALLPTGAKSSRAGYLRSLSEIIGDRPTHPWQSEWPAMLMELKRNEGSVTQRDDGQWVAIRAFRWGSGRVAHGEVVNEAWIEKHECVEVLSDAKKSTANGWVPKAIQNTVDAGWTHADAKTLILLLIVRVSMCRALLERDQCYAAATYALCEIFATKAAEQERRGQRPPTVYRLLRGGAGTLADADPAWEHLEQPDAAGFRGLCSLLAVRGDSMPDRFKEGGMTLYDVATARHLPRAEPVVAFESAGEDEHGYHAGVVIERANVPWSESEAVFPPNCLYRLKRVQPDGFESPGGVWVRQKLLVVTATYRSPLPRSDLGTAGSRKMCGSALTLAYGDRKVFVDGFDALVPAKPPLTMAMEFDRDHSWSDWKHERYTLRDEWAYVHAPALRSERCTPGTRDDANDGVSLEQFCERARAHVAARRAEGCGQMLRDDAAYLTREEVVAVRLYSGPSYIPINLFLRQVAACSGVHRHTLATHPLHSFAATARHLTSAIRKLAATASAEEAAAPLWRGVRGELKNSFWVHDEQGLVCAVDTAFMSTSRKRETPIDYMDVHGPNVLWELQPRAESDTAYHHGADISMLSQYAAEAEVVFPPCTMLVVRDQQHEALHESELATAPKWSQERGGRFLPVSVQPAFV